MSFRLLSLRNTDITAEVEPFLNHIGDGTMELHWEEGFAIRVRTEGGTAVLSANREGLLSLAAQLTALSRATAGSHIHYDAFNSLEDGSDELIIELTEQREKK